MNRVTPTPRHKPRTSVLPGHEHPEHLIAMFNYMEKYRKENGWAPSNREMVEAGFARSTSVIRYYYEVMQEYGMIEFVPKISRGIRLHDRKDWNKFQEMRKQAKMEVQNEHA